jgi:16S rRNA (cytosine1402-N4)-methyltransferase
MCVYHHPVLLRESVAALAVKPNGIYVDATFGGGGHSRAILEQMQDGRLYAFDCDADAANNTIKDHRFVLIRNNFKYIQNCLRYVGCTTVDGIFADLGVSSHQFDTKERGFSFRFDADLDMRMNRDAQLTAAQVLNKYAEKELERLFSQYGEVPHSKRIAALIVKARTQKQITSSGELMYVLSSIAPQHHAHKFWATIFQSLRIEVNKEMEALESLLEQSLRLLNSGGRLSIITYHSLEDRMVKNVMRTGNIEGHITKDFYGNSETPFVTITKKAITPSLEEVAQNNRARSAKLRVAEKRGLDRKKH